MKYKDLKLYDEFDLLGHSLTTDKSIDSWYKKIPTQIIQVDIDTIDKSLPVYSKLNSRIITKHGPTNKFVYVEHDSNILRVSSGIKVRYKWTQTYPGTINASFDSDDEITTFGKLLR